MAKDRLERAIQQKVTEGKNVFIPYIMAGDGGLDQLETQIAFLEKCGVTAIEIGIPFSDPVADGPIIQAAGKRSLANGTTLVSVLKKLQSLANKYSTPIILMTYLNPIVAYGIEKFTMDCIAANVDGIIIPDLPLEEEAMITPFLQKQDIALIRLATLTSPADRLKQLTERAEGFLYAVSVTGTTGKRASFRSDVKRYLQTLKKHSSVPVLVGFGISGPEQARELAEHCDGIIVGSAIVDLLHQKKFDEINIFIKDSI